ncbi:hypothetical protein RHS01_08086 [Rhizoctonia solani]|uniref:Transmembrane protein n=1 Tax=Rhizoctonia solani TaxID=456999 RepID=A0A8H7M4Z2_9AGAM|nr:hypothetical protein RHS01_08086 [Rhizoctonia solani]
MSVQGAASHHHLFEFPPPIFHQNSMHTPGNVPTTEQTPLLFSSDSDSSSSSSSSDRDCRPKAQHTPVPWTYHVVTLAFVALSLVLCLVVTLIFTIHSYVGPLLRADPSVLAQRSLVVEGPSRFKVINYTSDGIWCELGGLAAIDASRTFGLSSSHLTDRIASWAARRVGSVTITTPEVQVFSYDATFLAALELPAINLPLTTSSPPKLKNVTVQALFRPARNIDNILKFASHSWETGAGELRVRVPKGVVAGGKRPSGWRKWIRIEKHDIAASIKLTVHPSSRLTFFDRFTDSFVVPPIPGLPPAPPNGPRPTPDLASLVYLQSYHILPPPPTLRLVGTATLPNPLPFILRGAIELSLPFVVSLPPLDSKDPLPIARVETAPLALTAPNISLAISGHVLPLPSSSSSISPVSKFASDFLAARSSPVLITTDFLRDLGVAGEITMKAEFPASGTRPDLLRDVQISNMRISLRGEQILASAFVRAHIVPPNSLSAVHINATRVWPDLLVYDGPAPQLWPFDDPSPRAYSGIEYDEHWTEPDPMPLPRPLPPNAFARIRPDSWVLAHTESSDGQQSGENQGVWVHAQVTDIPLDVLPGRNPELQRFIRKVLFNPNAGRGELEMYGLPLRGETTVGKKSLLGWSVPSPDDSIPTPIASSIPTSTRTVPTPSQHPPVLTYVPEPPRRLEPVPMRDPEPEPEPDAEPEYESEFRAEPQLQPEPEVEVESEPYFELDDEYEYEYEPAPTPAPSPTPAPAPVHRSEPEPQLEPELEYEPEPPVERWPSYGGWEDPEDKLTYEVQGSEELWQVGVAY